MSEHDFYLSSIFGSDALLVHMDPHVKSYMGRGATFTLERPHDALNNQISRFQDHIVLAVKPHHHSGHFRQIETLPGYRIVELAALIEQNARVTKVSSARFKKIVRSPDVLWASRAHDNHLTVARRTDSGLQTVAQLDVTFAQQGLTAHELGLVLEMASQTSIANEIRTYPDDTELVFPLLLGFSHIAIGRDHLDQHLTILPSSLTDLDSRNRFYASVQIVGDSSRFIAEVHDMQFQFATGDQIRDFEAIQRNWF